MFSVRIRAVCVLQVILETLANACATYGRKNLRILYDALSTLAELVGTELAEPARLRIFMPPLVAKWQSLSDTDRDLLPLLECFTGIISAIGLCSILCQAPGTIQLVIRQLKACYVLHPVPAATSNTWQCLQTCALAK